MKTALVKQADLLQSMPFKEKLIETRLKNK